MMTSLFIVCGAVLLFVAWNAARWPGVRAHDATGNVSVLIPARNEERSLGAALDRVMAEKCIEEILVYDDHSTDGTAAVVREAALRDPRVRLVDAEPLPEGWCGKPFACARLAAAARGEWLLFLDADARLQPGAVPRMLYEAQQRGATFVSFWPGLELRSFWEKLFMPLLNFVVFSLFPAPLSLKKVWPSLGLAHGACLLIRRAEYERSGGHALVRGELFEDTALARAWRARGMLSLCLDGQDVVRVRMYDSLEGMWRGFLKNSYPAFRREVSFWLFLAFHFFLFVFPCGVAAGEALAGQFDLAAWGAVACAACARAVQAFRFRFPLWSAFLHPVAEGGLLAVALISWMRYRWGGGVEWKGRRYSKRNP